MIKLTYPEANKRLRELISTIEEDTCFRSDPNRWCDHPLMAQVIEVEDSPSAS